MLRYVFSSAIHETNVAKPNAFLPSPFSLLEIKKDIREEQLVEIFQRAGRLPSSSVVEKKRKTIGHGAVAVKFFSAITSGRNGLRKRRDSSVSVVLDEKKCVKSVQYQTSF